MLEAIILGIIQGLTEFIPVSSSGHLVLAQSAFSGTADHLFIQTLDIGTTLALIIYFWPRLIDLYKQIFHKRDYRLGRNIILTSIPAGLVGLLLGDMIEASTLLVTPLMVISMLTIVGVLMVLSDRLPKKSATNSGSDLSPYRAFTIGVAQMFALIPGVSRSGSTILAGRAMGLNARAAAEYSFLVSIPIMLGLILLLFVKSTDRHYILQHLDIVVASNVAAFITGMIAIKFMLDYLSKHGLKLFGWYRIGVAAVVGLVLLVQLVI